MIDAPDLPAGLSVVAGRTVRSARHWVDTFDRRLLVRGIEMHFEPARPRTPSRVVVTSLSGPVTVADWTVPVPSQAVVEADLPPPIADCVRPFLAGRALLPLMTAVVSERLDRAIDDQQKTVCRLVVQEAGRVSTVSVQPLRGYEAEGRTVSEALGGPAKSLLTLLLEDAGRADAPGSQPAGHGIDPDAPAAEGVAYLITRLLGTVAENLPGTLARYDDEFLHDLRVAVRRARTALKLAREFVEPKTAEVLAVELKWLGDVTTPARDLDVHIQDLPRMAGAVTADLRSALDPFVTLLTSKRERAYTQLRRSLRSERFARLMADAPGSLADLAMPIGDGDAVVTTDELARTAVQVAFTKVVKRGRRLTPDSPEESVHDLRKRAKELRYGLEFFAERLGPERVDLVRDLKELQDVLGGYNDSAVQRAFLRECAAELHAGGAPAPTILALGEMSGAIARSGAKARAELADRVRMFNRWSRTGRFYGMLDGA